MIMKIPTKSRRTPSAAARFIILAACMAVGFIAGINGWTLF
jgi:hypothetical protein